MTDPHDLGRFVAAQDKVYAQALAELAAGRKQSHWMWFIFPQLARLGRSATALYYGIQSREEARAYLDHAVLGPRLRACTAAVLRHRTLPPRVIFGEVDALKFRSSMTLFDAVAGAGEPAYREALAAFYDGAPDPQTLALLS